MPHTREKGKSGEEIAEKFLVEKGFKIIERNYFFGRGEIDIIADDDGILVFVEVKSREAIDFGEPENSITMGKRRQIRKVAEGYLYEKNISGVEARFDVVAIKWEQGKPVINYYPDAF